jgi:chromosome segregation ATPase
MQWAKLNEIKLDQEMSEFVPRDGVNPEAAVVKFPARQIAGNSDNASAVLDLVSEAAEGIRRIQEQAAEAVDRAHSVADEMVEKLEIANGRADRAEEALRSAEARVEEIAVLAAQMRSHLETLQTQLTTREAELAAAERRAHHAERRADDANAAIQRISEAIRTQLPV